MDDSCDLSRRGRAHLAARSAVTLLLMLWGTLRGENPGCGDYECDECYGND